MAATELHRILTLFRDTLFCMGDADVWKSLGRQGYRTLFCRLKAGGITSMLTTRQKWSGRQVTLLLDLAPKASAFACRPRPEISRHPGPRPRMKRTDTVAKRMSALHPLACFHGGLSVFRAHLPRSPRDVCRGRGTRTQRSQERCRCPLHDVSRLT